MQTSPDTQIGPINVTTEQVELIKRTVANGATDQELKLFLYDCARRGVHPLDRMIHFTKRGGKYVPVTSIDFMRTQASDSGEMAGSEDAVFQWHEENGQPGAATVTVYRMTQGARYAYTATARWDEYYPGDSIGHMWKKMPHTMLAKCAEALALRKAFPRQLQGLYAREEMDQADDTEADADRARHGHFDPDAEGDWISCSRPGCKTRASWQSLGPDRKWYCGNHRPDKPPRKAQGQPGKPNDPQPIETPEARTWRLLGHLHAWGWRTDLPYRDKDQAGLLARSLIYRELQEDKSAALQGKFDFEEIAEKLDAILQEQLDASREPTP